MTSEIKPARDLPAERAKLSAALGELKAELAEVECRISELRADRGAAVLSAKLGGEAVKADKNLPSLLAKAEETRAAIAAAGVALAEVDDAAQRQRLEVKATEYVERAERIRSLSAEADRALAAFAAAWREIWTISREDEVGVCGLVAGNRDVRNAMWLYLKDRTLHEPRYWQRTIAELAEPIARDFMETAKQARGIAARSSNAPLPKAGEPPAPAQLAAAE